MKIKLKDAKVEKNIIDGIEEHMYKL